MSEVLSEPDHPIFGSRIAKGENTSRDRWFVDYRSTVYRSSYYFQNEKAYTIEVHHHPENDGKTFRERFLPMRLNGWSVAFQFFPKRPEWGFPLSAIGSAPASLS